MLKIEMQIHYVGHKMGLNTESMAYSLARIDVDRGCMAIVKNQSCFVTDYANETNRTYTNEYMYIVYALSRNREH